MFDVNFCIYWIGGTYFNFSAMRSLDVVFILGGEWVSWVVWAFRVCLDWVSASKVYWGIALGGVGVHVLS